MNMLGMTTGVCAGTPPRGMGSDRRRARCAAGRGSGESAGEADVPVHGMMGQHGLDAPGSVGRVVRVTPRVQTAAPPAPAHSGAGAAFAVGVVLGGGLAWVGARDEVRARTLALVRRCGPPAAQLAAGVGEVLPPRVREAAGHAVAGWAENARDAWDRPPETVRRVEEAVVHGIEALGHWTEGALRTHARLEVARGLEDAIHAYLKHGEPGEFPGVTERTRIRRPPVPGVTRSLYVGHSGLVELLDTLREHLDVAEAPLALTLASPSPDVVRATSRIKLSPVSVTEECTGLPDELRTVRHHVFDDDDTLAELREDLHADLSSALLQDVASVDYEAEITG